MSWRKIILIAFCALLALAIVVSFLRSPGDEHKMDVRVSIP